MATLQLNGQQYKLITIIVYFSCLAMADITDMPSEAICAAQCLANFTNSLNETERVFFYQRPDLTESHCVNKRSNCSLCLEVCRWPLHNTTDCDSSCNNIDQKLVSLLSNSPLEEHQQTCLNACQFTRSNYLETEDILAGRKQPVCPLVTSWPDSCQRTCSSDTDCQSTRASKCCQLDACQAGSERHIQFARPQNQLQRGRTHTGVCTQVVATTEGVPPVPGQMQVRLSVIETGEVKAVVDVPRLYRLDLDWPEYYNNTSTVTTDTMTTLATPASVAQHHTRTISWSHPVVFLVQLRLNRRLSIDRSLVSSLVDENDPDMLNEHEFTEWRSLVYTTKLGAVLSDLSPDTWYQFRLMAASASGFGGISRPSRPVKVLPMVEAPSSPRNFTEGPSRIYANKVEVKLLWQAPAIGSAHVKFYKITLKQHNSQQIDESTLSDYEVKVPKNVLTYTIHDLQPGTVYQVQVIAISLIDGKEVESSSAILYIKTISLPIRDYAYSSRMSSHVDELSVNKSCKCGMSSENQYWVQPPFFEDGNLKATLTIPSHIIHQYIGTGIKDTTVFDILWFPKVCIESQNSRLGHPASPNRITVYKSALANFNLESLRFQCHYNVRIQTRENPVNNAPKNTLDLCFCTPSCHEVQIKSGPGPRNCTIPELMVPHGPVDVSYRLIPTNVHFRQQPIYKEPHGKGAASSQPEIVPIFPVRNIQQPGFDAIIFWKPHPKMIATSSGFNKYPPSFSPYEKTGPRMKSKKNKEMLQSLGYRVIWGPRLIEPIEPEMYNNGIAPQLDPERTESKVVDSQIHNVILRNLAPETLYIVQVQTIGNHADSPVNRVFFTTPSYRIADTTSSSYGSRGILLASLLPLLNSWLRYL